MAKAPLTFSLILLLLSLAISLPSLNSQEFARKLSKRAMGMIKREELTHLHFYFHDVIGGSKPTSVVVARAATTASDPNRFGEVLVVDDRLTVGPNLSSRVVGRAQGMYALSDMGDAGDLVMFNFVFAEGRFDGSTLTVVGRDAVLSAEREVPVIGGTGAFRFARGYARTRTHLLDVKRGYVVEEYHVYVFHY